MALQLDYLPLWLAKISITPAMKKNNPTLVDKLIQYQLKAKDVLVQAFLPTNKPKETEATNQVAFEEVVKTLPVFADFLKVNDVSKLIMAKKLCEDYNVPLIVYSIFII